MCGIGLAIGPHPDRAATFAAPYIAARGPHQHGVLIDRSILIRGDGPLPTGDPLLAILAVAHRTVLLHSRLATSTYAIRPADAQPLRNGRAILAHNGVVPGWRPTPESTVDSAAILDALAAGATLTEALTRTGVLDVPHAVIAYSPADAAWTAHRNRLPLYASIVDDTLIVSSRIPGGTPLPEHEPVTLEAP